MQRSTIVVMLTLLLAGAGVAEARGIGGGEVRLGLQTTLYSSTSTDTDVDDDDTDIATLSLGGSSLGLLGGYCLTDKIELGALLAYTNVEVNDDNDSSTLLLGAYFNYNHPVGSSALYAEAMLIHQSTENGLDLSQQGISLGGGFKAFVVEDGSLDIGLRLFWLTGEYDTPVEDVDVDTTGFMLNIGMSLWLGGGGAAP